MIPWETVCRRCLCRAKENPNAESWCPVCHAEVVAEMNENLNQPAGCIGTQSYAGEGRREWAVVWSRRNKVRVRLITGAADLLPLYVEISR